MDAAGISRSSNFFDENKEVSKMKWKSLAESNRLSKDIES
jgi:hypothetical protein